MIRYRSSVLLLITLFILLPLTTFAEEQYDENSAEYKQISSLFVCPECSTVGAELNERFVAEILELMNAGYTEAEIKDYFVDVYGESILAAPEKSGFSLFAWITPFAVIGVAAIGIFLYIRKSVQQSNVQ